MGRLEPLKAIPLALAAIAKLQKRGEEWNLTIAGEGPDELRLRKLAETYGITDRVKFVGRVPRIQVLELMISADVMLSTCMREAAGFAVAEAVELGLPVVFVDRGGPAVIVDANAGFGVEPGPAMAERFATAIQRACGIATGPSATWTSQRLPTLIAELYATGFADKEESIANN